MKNVPTDLQILNEIYNCYYDDFASYSKENPTRSTKNYVPIEIKKIATKLNVDGDIVFGRLYYHLENKYGYKNEDGSNVSLFASRLTTTDIHCVNFPYMASVLADLRNENKKFITATAVAVFSLIISVASLIIALNK